MDIRRLRVETLSLDDEARMRVLANLIIDRILDDQKKECLKLLPENSTIISEDQLWNTK